MALEPITVLTTISLGLKLIDQFRDLALRFMEKRVEPPAGTTEQAEDKIRVRYDGTVVDEVSADQLNMTEWDDVRYQTLRRRAQINWQLFNEFDAELPLLATDEKVRIRLRMERVKDELCEDFREMVRIYEQTLGISLPDHYTLYDTCGVA